MSDIDVERSQEITGVISSFRRRYPFLFPNEYLGKSGKRKSDYVNTIMPSDAEARRQRQSDLRSARREVWSEIDKIQKSLPHMEDYRRQLAEDELQKLHGLEEVLDKQLGDIWK